ncbi:unnamed protein product [Diamesa serratosioi]
MKWPTSCPIKAFTICNETLIIDMRPYKRFIFLMAGEPVVVEYHATHDNNGYQVKNSYVKMLKVKGEPVIKFIGNLTITYTPDCRMLLTMCLDSIGTRTIITKLTIYVGSVKFFEETMDSCDKVENADKNFKNVLDAMNWPASCPVKAVRIIEIYSKWIHIISNRFK